MLMYFHHVAHTNKLSALELFQLAYMWKKQKLEPVVTDDYCQYLLHSILPEYVCDYLTAIRQGEVKCSYTRSKGTLLS